MINHFHDPDVELLIEAEFPLFHPDFQQVLILRDSGYGVTEIARMLGTYRNAVYRVIRKAQRHLSQPLY